MTRSKALKIFWVTPKWPFPVTDGARVATTELLRSLSSRGAEITLGSIVPDDEMIDVELAIRELGVRDVRIIRKKKSTRFRMFLHFLFRPFFPVTLAPYATPQIAKELATATAETKFDFIVYDGLHGASARLVSPADEGSIPEVYRAHNVESEIWFRAARESLNPIKRILLAYQGSLVRRLEERLVRRSRHVFPVSEEDEQKLKGLADTAKFRTLPIGMRIRNAPASDSAGREFIRTGKKILFVGRLDWAPNRDGLKWFLRNVWPRAMMEGDGISLDVVGSGNHAWIEEFRGLPGLNVVGAVGDLFEFYQSCVATVVPIFYGSGTRVKAIESCLHGRVCISTRMGVEGIGLIPGENYYAAESADEWVAALTSLRSAGAHEMGLRAREYSRQTYDSSVIADRFLRAVSGT